MLDDYKDKQTIAYNIMKNEIYNNHISHAYLIDENNNIESFNIVMAFIKEILCVGLNNYDREVLCKRIDDGNYPEIKIIEPDGMLIKKRQILDLQQEFSMAAIEGNKRIYIIKDADKMRSETANSMLKFLEEPENNIIAILMTNNYNNLLSTIISRCQVIRLNNDLKIAKDANLEDFALKLILLIENKKNKAIINEKYFFDLISLKERENYVIIFDKMIDMYYDILKICNGIKTIKFSDYYNDFYNIACMNSQYQILNKITIILSHKDRIRNNVNMNLLFDSLVISVGGK